MRIASLTRYFLLLGLADCTAIAQFSRDPFLNQYFRQQAGIRSVGDLVADIANSIGRAREEQIAATAKIEEARKRFWTAYPSSPDLIEAKAEYERVLAVKELSLLVAMLPFGEPVKEYELLNTLAGGKVDNGIPYGATATFRLWVQDIRSRLGVNRGQLLLLKDRERLSKAISEAESTHRAFLIKRDLEEFRAAGKTPPGIDPLHWTIISNAVTAMQLTPERVGQENAFYKNWFSEDAYDRAYAFCDQSIQLFGKDYFFEKAKRILTSGRDIPVPSEYGNWSNHQPFQALLNHLGSGTPKFFLLGVLREHFGGFSDWTESVNAYEGIVQEMGEEATLALGTKLMMADKTVYLGGSGTRWPETVAAEKIHPLVNGKWGIGSLAKMVSTLKPVGGYKNLNANNYFSSISRADSFVAHVRSRAVLSSWQVDVNKQRSTKGRIDQAKESALEMVYDAYVAFFPGKTSASSWETFDVTEVSEDDLNIMKRSAKAAVDARTIAMERKQPNLAPPTEPIQPKPRPSKAISHPHNFIAGAPTLSSIVLSTRTPEQISSDERQAKTYNAMSRYLGDQSSVGNPYSANMYNVVVQHFVERSNIAPVPTQLSMQDRIAWADQLGEIFLRAHGVVRDPEEPVVAVIRPSDNSTTSVRLLIFALKKASYERLLLLLDMGPGKNPPPVYNPAMEPLTNAARTARPDRFKGLDGADTVSNLTVELGFKLFQTTNLVSFFHSTKEGSDFKP